MSFLSTLCRWTVEHGLCPGEDSLQACEVVDDPSAEQSVFFAAAPSPSSHSGGEKHTDGFRPPACQVVVTDVDGTLLPFGQRRVSQGNRAALERAMEAGCHVCFATSRLPGPWSDELRTELPGLGPGVYGDGALLLSSNGDVLFEATLPTDVVRLVEAFFRGGKVQG